MSQADIQSHYRDHWGQAEQALRDRGDAALIYSSPIEDAVIYPVYQKLIADLSIPANGANILDIGCGAGRWVRFFLDRYAPASITGVDFAESSVMLLREWAGSLQRPCPVAFQAADITAPDLAIDRPAGAKGFDTINVGNVLFHIPEPDKFQRALGNIAGLLSENGRVITTEYLPRVPTRTNWMAVRSRYEFAAACQQAGLEIAEIRPCSFFSNDPMGIDGPGPGQSPGTRQRFAAVRALTKQLLQSAGTEQSRQFVTALFAEIEHACLDFCNERIAPIDMPAQKLVVLRRASDG